MSPLTAKIVGLFCFVCLEAKKLNSWRDQNSLILGPTPKERFGHGFTETLGRLYVFGGTTLSRGIDMKYFSVASRAYYLGPFAANIKCIFSCSLPQRFAPI